MDLSTINTIKPEDLLSTIQNEALEISGLSYERAFAIDSHNIANEIDSFAFLNLSDLFFTKLIKDKTSSFSGLFHEESLEFTMKAFADYLYQRCGGGSSYTDHHGFLSIAERHIQYHLTGELVEKWCDVMEDCLYRMRADFSSDQSQWILDFLRYQGYEMIVWAKYQNLVKKKGPLF